jgi:hypothetical protein
MRKLRNFAIVALLLAATNTFAASTTTGTTPQLRDGGDIPPMCVPGDPNCKP